MRVQLTQGQFKVLQERLAGYTEQQTMVRLQLSPYALKSQTQILYLKFGVNSLVELKNLFGHLECKPVWVINPNAPIIQIKGAKNDSS